MIVQDLYRLIVAPADPDGTDLIVKERWQGRDGVEVDARPFYDFAAAKIMSAVTCAIVARSRFAVIVRATTRGILGWPCHDSPVYYHPVEQAGMPHSVR
jgi:hypothetical protein